MQTNYFQQVCQEQSNDILSGANAYREGQDVVLHMAYFSHIEAGTNGRHFADAIFKCIFLNENV